MGRRADPRSGRRMGGWSIDEQQLACSTISSPPWWKTDERPPTMMRAMKDASAEARAILDLCDGSALRAFDIVQGQLGVLVLRTQVMLSLSGIVITVTGFSGRAIAETSLLARVSVVSGLVLVLAAAAVAVGGVLRLKWLTEELGPEPLVVLTKGIALRDRKARFLSVALTLFVLGFSLYCLAVAQLLIAA